MAKDRINGKRGGQEVSPSPVLEAVLYATGGGDVTRSASNGRGLPGKLTAEAVGAQWQLNWSDQLTTG